MSNRKATPDILGEILGSPAPAIPPATDPVADPATAPATGSTSTGSTANGTKSASSAAVRKPRRRNGAAQTKPQPRVVWEYMTVTLGEHNGWRPRQVNETELENWKYQPPLREFLTVVGTYGWELTAVVDAGRNRKEAYFKRPRP